MKITELIERQRSEWNSQWSADKFLYLDWEWTEKPKMKDRLTRVDLTRFLQQKVRVRRDMQNWMDWDRDKA